MLFELSEIRTTGPEAEGDTTGILGDVQGPNDATVVGTVGGEDGVGTGGQVDEDTIADKGVVFCLSHYCYRGLSISHFS